MNKWLRIGAVIALAAAITSCNGGATPSSTATTSVTPATTSSTTPTGTSGTSTTVVPTTVPTTTPAVTPTTTPPASSVTPTTTPPVTTTTAPTTPVSGVVTFDFDTGSPAPAPRQTLTPFDQTSGGLTAHFSSPFDPYAFSVQNESTTFLKLGQLQGNYLYPNQITRATLVIRFSQPVKGVALTFATADSHDPGNVEQPTDIKLSGFVNTFAGAPVATTTSRGVFSSDAYPQGKASLVSGAGTFNVLVIELVVQPKAGTGVMVDNVVVTF